jgi:aspartate-semialdehyde dehydrogenase
MNYNIAVVGATGNVGHQMLSTLAERNFPVNDVFAVASAKSQGKKVSFGDNTLTVQSLTDFDFRDVDIALFSPGSQVSSEFAPIAAKHAVVIDNTSFFRMFDDIPLVVPEVNSSDIALFKNRNIISNPNCAVIQLVVALKPLHEVAKIKRVVITTFQSVSGAGKAAMDELYFQTKGKFINEHIPPSKFKKQIAFNCIPQIGDIESNLNTNEENKIVSEVKKILDPNIQVSATCVRVPVFVGHSESVNIEFEEELSPEMVRKILKKAPGVVVIDSPEKSLFITPQECVGDNEVYVSRIRKDESTKNALNMWIVSDNLKKGAALNAVQIAEELISNYL